MPNGGYSYLEKRTKVKDSPVGHGEVTNISHAGFPEVNGVAVAWLEFEDGGIFDPYEIRDDFLKKREQK